MKKISANGNVYYTSYKRKVGRKKKRGQKKKLKKRGRSWQEKWNFKIVRCLDKKQEKYIGVFHNLEEVNEYRDKLIEENSKVIFPVKYVNNGHKNNNLYEYASEYVILKRITENDSNVSQLMNEYGKFIDVSTNSEQWYVFDRFPCLKEETFWVYGLNPKSERKTFEWIYTTLIKNMLVSFDSLIRIMLYNNKVIFQYDEDFNFVICKNISDAIRFYNLIDNDIYRDKRVIMLGATGRYTDTSVKVFKMIKDKTGWEDTKIRRTSTRA